MADPQSSQEDTPQLESLTLGELAFLSAFRTLPPEVQQALMEGLRQDDPKPLFPFRDQIRLWFSTWSRNLSDQPRDQLLKFPPTVEQDDLALCLRKVSLLEVFRGGIHQSQQVIGAAFQQHRHPPHGIGGRVLKLVFPLGDLLLRRAQCFSQLRLGVPA